MVTLVSASKGWNLPGLMCAQVILSNRRDAHDSDRITCCTAWAHQRSVSARTSPLPSWRILVEGVVPHLRANRDHLARALPGVSSRVEVNAPDGTYLSWGGFPCAGSAV